jgi:hypothetical protein
MFPACANQSCPSPNAWSLSRADRLAQPDLLYGFQYSPLALCADFPEHDTVKTVLSKGRVCAAGIEAVFGSARPYLRQSYTVKHKSVWRRHHLHSTSMIPLIVPRSVVLCLEERARRRGPLGPTPSARKSHPV